MRLLKLAVLLLSEPGTDSATDDPIKGVTDWGFDISAP
jgi:hypothetical protein